MGLFSDLFGITFKPKYYIEADAIHKKYLEKYDVFVQISEHVIYNTLDGHVEVGSEYIKTCKEIPKQLYELIVSGIGKSNPYYKNPN